MKMLLAKDWRVNRTAVIGSIVLVSAPYFIVTIGVTFARKELRPGDVGSAALSAANVALWLTAILAAVFGGVAFAHERRERSALFLAMMPTTRANIVASKLIIALSCLTVLWLVNVFVVATTALTRNWSLTNGDWFYILMPTTAGVMMFGVAWLLSSFLTSPTVAASIAMGVTIGFIYLVGVIVYLVAPEANPRIARNADFLAEMIFAMAPAFVGIISCIAGTIYYLRRIEP
jgi:ABC-type transport system involved in multi-copper enzyme maturation permease subunit